MTVDLSTLNPSEDVYETGFDKLNDNFSKVEGALNNLDGIPLSTEAVGDNDLLLVKRENGVVEKVTKNNAGLGGGIGGFKTFALEKALQTGDRVKILSNGNIDTISGPNELGFSATFKGTAIEDSDVVELGNDKVFVAYTPGNARIATLSGTNISYGTEYSFTGSRTEPTSITKLSNTKVFITYTDWGDQEAPVGIVATINGNVITYGTPVKIINGAGAGGSVSVTKIGTDKVFIMYKDQSDSNHGAGIVATISGTTITYGTANTFLSTTSVFDIECKALEDDKVLMVYGRGNTGQHSLMVATISGTTITYGSEQASGRRMFYPSMAVLNNSKVFVTFGDGNSSQRGTSFIINISGTTITIESAYVHYVNASNWNSAVKISETEVFIVYGDGANSNNGYYVIATINGNVISYATRVVFNSNRTEHTSTTITLNGKVFTSYASGSGSAGNAKVYGPGAEVFTNYIGILQEGGNQGELKPVAILGEISSVHSGLNPGDELPYGIVLSNTEILVRRNT